MDTPGFVQVDGSDIHVRFNTAAEGKIALKELKLKRKEYSLLKRQINEREREIRAQYTDQTRRQGSMMRGGGGFGKFIRGIESISRDSQRANLAKALAPLEKQKSQVDSMLQTFDSVILQVETHILKLEQG